ncbi:hypothetical protein QIS99_25490 [Streptomyces sp. B-S-A8]|uniref:Uncharacterized protein n=1 Tax=Streptomyces solicavernae TaxID=3043614 RepID=A0ABT6RYK2_9ACTN|nr:hypothetical protein [Streptomyces sp. B-S-A8]MDI3389521.1 hypothetical protein [Streptomyces sp. B-S-A8]
MIIESAGSDPSEFIRALLVGTGLVFALLRWREARTGTPRGRFLLGADLVLAVALVPLSGRFDDLVTSLARQSALIPLAAGLVAGLAGMATTGLAAAAVFALDGGGTSTLAWVVSPLLVGAALRTVRHKPEIPPRLDPLLQTGLFQPSRGMVRELPGGMTPALPGPSDVFWAVTARLVCVVPLLLVFLIPGDGELSARIGGGLLLWAMLLAYDRARRPLLMPHRRLARITDTGVFLVLLVVAAGPLGELVARWWSSHPSVDQWWVALFAFVLAMVHPLAEPRFDGRRRSWLLTRSTRFLFGAHQLILVAAAFPFLVGGVFHPTRKLMEASALALAIGFFRGALTAVHATTGNRHIADVMLLLKAPSGGRERLLDQWVSDTFYRRRWWLIPRPWDYSLPRMTAVLAQLSAESSVATAGVYWHLVWGERVRLDHSSVTGLLKLADQILDRVDACFPSIRATSLHRAQQTARADVACHRSNVAQYLHDFEGIVAAANQAADHYTAIDAPSHAAVVRIFAADRLSDVGQHETAAALLSVIPGDLPPAVRRLLLISRAASAHRTHRTTAARALLTAARAIPARTIVDFRKAFAAERIAFPSFAEGARSAMITAELHLDRALGGTHPSTH